MNLSENQIIEKYGKKCGHCSRNTLPPYEYESICIACEYNLIKRKRELSKIRRKKIFISLIKYAEHKNFCLCIEVYQIYESNDFNKINEVLSTLKNKNLKGNNALIEKY